MYFGIDVHAHVIAGLLLVAPGVFWALVLFKRLKKLILELEQDDDDKAVQNDICLSYCRRYFPEPHSSHLKGIGCYFIMMAMAGYGILTLTEVPQGMSLFSDTFHLMLYLLYGVTGFVFFLEGKTNRIPQDAAMGTLAFSMALESLMLYIHAGMKPTKTRELQHVLISLIVFVSSMALTTSLMYRMWLAPYVVFVATFLWQGLWWIVIGLTFLPEDGIEMKDVPIHFALVGLVLYMTGLCATSRLRASIPDYRLASSTDTGMVV